jgi:hypothetical protein
MTVPRTTALQKQMDKSWQGQRLRESPGRTRTYNPSVNNGRAGSPIIEGH